jgi:hypothetical protein
MRVSLTLACALCLVASAYAAEDDLAAEADAEVEAPKKPWKVGASVTFSRLVVGDDDPENDMALTYGAKASGKAAGVTAFLGVGLRSVFTDATGIPPDRLQDTRVGASYATPVELGDGLELGIKHQLELFLPTSTVSQKRDLYVAPMASVSLGMEPIEGLSVGLSPHFRYRFHGTALRHGGSANVQYDTGVHVDADYTLALGKFGDLTAGFSTGTVWVHKYDAPSNADIAADDLISGSATASLPNDTEQTFQTYDYEVHLAYTPLPYASLSVGLEQGGGVLRNGVVNTFLFHRDETQLVVSLSGSY